MSDEKLVQALRGAVIALAHAATKDSTYQRAYEQTSDALAEYVAHESRAQPASKWPNALTQLGFPHPESILEYLHAIDVEVARITGDEGEDSSLKVLSRLPDYQPAQPASVPLKEWMRDRAKLTELAEHLESVGWRPGPTGDAECYDQGAAMAAEIVRVIIARRSFEAQPASVADGFASWGDWLESMTDDELITIFYHYPDAANRMKRLLAAAPQPAKESENVTK